MHLRYSLQALYEYVLWGEGVDDQSSQGSYKFEGDVKIYNAIYFEFFESMKSLVSIKLGTYSCKTDALFQGSDSWTNYRFQYVEGR